MKRVYITKPIGLREPCAEVENVCQNARVYQFGGQLKHIILPMDPGTGRSTFIEYLTNMFRAHGVLEFACSRTPYLEVTVDPSSPRHVQDTFTKIHAAADYANEYADVVGLDVSEMANYLNQAQMKEYLRNVQALCKTAFVVFFIHANPSKNEESLIEKTIEAVGSDRIKRLKVSAYTKEDICALITKFLADHGIEVEQSPNFDKALGNIVSEFYLTSVKDAISTAQELVHFADFSDVIPVITANGLSSMSECWRNNNERSEAK